MVGTWALRSIDGVMLPAPWAQNEALVSRMTSATLLLRADGTGTWHAVIEETPGGTLLTEDADVTYTRDGANIAISFTCNDLADCIAGPHLVGTWSDTGLTITTSLVTRAPLVFEAVG